MSACNTFEKNSKTVLIPTIQNRQGRKWKERGREAEGREQRGKEGRKEAGMDSTLKSIIRFITRQIEKNQNESKA